MSSRGSASSREGGWRGVVFTVMLDPLGRRSCPALVETTVRQGERRDWSRALTGIDEDGADHNQRWADRCAGTAGAGELPPSDGDDRPRPAGGFAAIPNSMPAVATAGGNTRGATEAERCGAGTTRPVALMARRSSPSRLGRPPGAPTKDCHCSWLAGSRRPPRRSGLRRRATLVDGSAGASPLWCGTAPGCRTSLFHARAVAERRSVEGGHRRGHPPSVDVAVACVQQRQAPKPRAPQRQR